MFQNSFHQHLLGGSHSGGCEEFFFWDLMPFSLLEVNGRFRRTCRRLLQD
jgi:hypothetical protein